MDRNKLRSSIRQFGQYRLSEKFKVDPESEYIKAHKNFVFPMSRIAAQILALPSVQKSFLALQAHWLSKYVANALEDLHDCYMAELADDGKLTLCPVFNGSCCFVCSPSFSLSTNKVFSSSLMSLFLQLLSKILSSSYAFLLLLRNSRKYL